MLLLAFFISGWLAFAQQETAVIEMAVEEVSFSDNNELNADFEQKYFNDSIHSELAKAVDLKEDLQHRNIEADSNSLGLGYGVEQGSSYYIYDYDSVSGETTISEQHRGSGAKNNNDGVNPDTRNIEDRREFERKMGQERAENRRAKLKMEELKRQQRLKNEARTEDDLSNKGTSLGGLAQFLAILIIGGLLGFGAYLLFAKSPVESSSSKIIYGQDFTPDEVKLSELEIKINDAKATADYRSATRLYFVWAIKVLSDDGVIEWKKRKTNYHYVNELTGKRYQSEFEVLVRNYELIWYGHYTVSARDFKAIEALFLQFIKSVQQ